MEVRYRHYDSRGSAAESVSAAKPHKLTLAAQHVLQQHTEVRAPEFRRSGGVGSLRARRGRMETRRIPARLRGP
ncbi:MAG TPA: hypothetical protein VGN70_07900 [Gammaproteobacteria bacterium]